MSGILYLLPTPLGERESSWLLPEDMLKIQPLTHFVVECEKTARKHLKLLHLENPIQSLHLQVLDEHTPENALNAMISPLLDGHDMALMSEAGCPAVADPGAQLVALAHRKQITVMPMVGASSILLALMASGANGQKFAFHGYLPADKNERPSALKQLEARSHQHQETQIFIETPYRNDAMLADILQTCRHQTHLCIAADLTLPTQTIISQSISEWKKSNLPTLKKRPCIFILFS